MRRLSSLRILGARLLAYRAELAIRHSARLTRARDRAQDEAAELLALARVRAGPLRRG